MCSKKKLINFIYKMRVKFKISNVIGHPNTLAIKSSLYSLNTLSGVTSERCPSPQLAPGPTLQWLSGGESLATCGRFDRLGLDYYLLLNLGLFMLAGWGGWNFAMFCRGFFRDRETDRINLFDKTIAKLMPRLHMQV